MRLLKIASDNPAKQNGWINPEGKFFKMHPSDRGMHSNMAQRLLRQGFISDPENLGLEEYHSSELQVYLVKNGWIRVYASDSPEHFNLSLRNKIFFEIQQPFTNSIKSKIIHYLGDSFFGTLGVQTSNLYWEGDLEAFEKFKGSKATYNDLIKERVDKQDMREDLPARIDKDSKEATAPVVREDQYPFGRLNKFRVDGSYEMPDLEKEDPNEDFFRRLSEVSTKRDILIKNNLLPNGGRVPLRNGKSLLVTKEPTDNTKWRVTSFDEKGEPWGHELCDTLLGSSISSVSSTLLGWNVDWSKWAGEKSSSLRPLNITAIVLKCNQDDISGEKSWCIYKENDTGNKADPQPKGFPKHFKTKEEAEKHLKRMQYYKHLK